MKPIEPGRSPGTLPDVRPTAETKQAEGSALTIWGRGERINELYSIL